MSRNIRMMIFGLPRDTSRQELQDLVTPCGDSRLALMDLPGDNDQAMAIVRPRDTGEVSAVLKLCHQHNQAYPSGFRRPV